MTIQDYKVSISGMLYEVQDARILATCFDLLQKHLTVKKAGSKQQVVGFQADGTPLTVEMLEKEILQAIARVEAGKGIKHEELLVEMENW